MSREPNDDELDRIFVRGDKIITNPVDWLWPGRIQRGAITDVQGDLGAAKSTLLADIGARLTAGREMPDSDFTPTAGGVVWIGSEDTTAMTRDNFRVAGAVLEKTKIYDKVTSTLILPDAVGVIEREVTRIAAGLVVNWPDISACCYVAEFRVVRP